MALFFSSDTRFSYFSQLYCTIENLNIKIVKQKPFIFTKYYYNTNIHCI